MDEIRVKLVNIKPMDDTQITKPTDCIDFMKRMIGDMSSEFFSVIYLNNANEPMNFHMVAKGGWKAALVDPKEVFTAALLQESPKIMLFHNHPSGHPDPSENDLATTEKLMKGAHDLELQVLDHIIVTKDDYFSFAAHDCLEFDDEEFTTLIKGRLADEMKITTVGGIKKAVNKNRGPRL